MAIAALCRLFNFKSGYELCKVSETKPVTKSVTQPESYWKNHKIVLLSCALITIGAVVLGSLGFVALLVSGIANPNFALFGAVFASLMSSTYFIAGCSSVGAGIVLGGIESIHNLMTYCLSKLHRQPKEDPYDSIIISQKGKNN